jgi:ribonuclease VapC
MGGYVVDASAALIPLRRERGPDRIADLLAGSTLCAVNAVEVMTRLVDEGITEEEATRHLASLGLRVAPFDLDLAIGAAALRHPTRHLGLSLGDRACLALALREGLPVLTADQAWADLDVGVAVEVVR